MTAASDDMPEADRSVASRRGRRAGRWLGGVALVVVIAGSALWIERKPIASDYIDRALARDHVPARYHIADLGFGRQRLTDVVIGDPAHPDLVADWIEVHTRIGVGGPAVTGISAGHVRLRGTFSNGRVSLGSIDRLLPAPSGKPFTLPALNIAVDDGRMRLVTPYGVVGLKLTGHGILNDGFSGHLAAISDRLALGGCTIGRAAAAVALHVRAAQPTIVGPVRAGSVVCGTTRVARATVGIDARLDETLDQWQGKARIALAQVARADMRVADLSGTIDFDGSPARTAGSVDLASAGFATPYATGAALALAGAYRFEGSFLAFQGTAKVRSAAVTRSLADRIAAFGAAGAGTPIGPLATKISAAALAASRSVDGDASFDALQSHGIGRLGLSRLIVSTASGARATLTSADGIQYAWPDSGTRIDGTLTLAGGGLPALSATLSQAQAGAPVVGIARLRPYAAADARLSLAPVRFRATPHGNTRFQTVVAITGPLGDGRIENARMPIDGLWDGAARIVIDPGCAPLAFDRLAVSGLALGAARMTLCPQHAALVAIDGAHVSAGARIAAPVLNGALGGTPLHLAADGASVDLGSRGFSLSRLAVRLGSPQRVTALDLGSLDGHLDGGAVTGRFTETGGTIANVPLVLSRAAGNWRLADGVLDLTGALDVADSAPTPRFEPLHSDDVSLRLAGGTITAGGTLRTPAGGIKVADVAITHDLSAGAGHADLTVPGITFGPAFQPDKLTPLTFGVIADVTGTVSGAGHIGWSPAGVSSTGEFKTQGTNLAAAFGPVTGLSTDIHFTDLLGLVSAPDQTATVADINPGVPVDDGVIHYQVLGPTRVKVLGATWPFSGGQLSLDPTVLDFSAGTARRLTFRVKGMNAAQFLQQFDFKNIDATGTFDGVLPMVFDADGGRIEDGHLTVREAGGTVAYVGDLSQKDLGTWGNMAYQALKSLRYDSLDITMDGPLSGEMITKVHFSGIKQGQGTKTNFIVRRLMRLPFLFNVTIRAPFRQLLTSAESFSDPGKLPQGKVQELLNQQQSQSTPAAPTSGKPIQPPESEKMP